MASDQFFRAVFRALHGYLLVLNRLFMASIDSTEHLLFSHCFPTENTTQTTCTLLLRDSM